MKLWNSPVDGWACNDDVWSAVQTSPRGDAWTLTVRITRGGAGVTWSASRVRDAAQVPLDACGVIAMFRAGAPLTLATAQRRAECFIGTRFPENITDAPAAAELFGDI